MLTMTSIKNWGRSCLIAPRWRNDGGLVGGMAGAINGTRALIGLPLHHGGIEESCLLMALIPVILWIICIFGTHFWGGCLR